MTVSELVGVWRLASFHDVDEDGNRREGPLGPEPEGLLFYSVEGHVSVHMMRTGPSAPGGGPGERPPQNYMSYSGTWRRSGDQVVHTLTLAPEPGWIGTDQVRDLSLDGATLTLHGDSLIGPRQRRVLVWRRVSPKAPPE
ncbi:lipocalin-like domain-containing protein [Streptomyces sp. NBC_00414]|uniref:lipocalin-like domain-containing protein n=1 Tax=Streptomyces sp. NBC_00414 TaxID=2975739 RepID=UPI002E2099D8